MMRKILLFVILIVLLVSIGWLLFSVYEKEETNKQIQKREEVLPDVSLESVAGDRYTISELGKGAAILLVYFNSTCEICQLELQNIGERIGDFSDVRIILVSSQEQEELMGFVDTHPLNKASNVYWLLDQEMEVATYYGVRSVPAIFCYDSSGDLHGKFNGPIKIDLLLDALKGKGEVME